MKTTHNACVLLCVVYTLNWYDLCTHLHPAYNLTSVHADAFDRNDLYHAVDANDETKSARCRGGLAMRWSAINTPPQKKMQPARTRLFATHKKNNGNHGKQQQNNHRCRKHLETKRGNWVCCLHVKRRATMDVHLFFPGVSSIGGA